MGKYVYQMMQEQLAFEKEQKAKMEAAASGAMDVDKDEEVKENVKRKEDGDDNEEYTNKAATAVSFQRKVLYV